MSDGEHLLAAIIAEPQDDLHRLVYADWLEENGREADARLCRWPGVVRMERGQHGVLESVAGWDLLTRADIGFDRGMAGALDALADRLPDWVEAAAFRRGLVCQVRCTLARWLAHGPALVRDHPLERATPSCRSPRRRQHYGLTHGLTGTQVLYVFSAAKDLRCWGEDSPRHWLPAAFAPYAGGERRGIADCVYRSPEEAEAAVSAACVAWARAKAEEAAGG